MRDEGRAKREDIKEFWDLEVWRKAKIFSVGIYRVTREFPREERFGLIDQMRRAAVSICANIAEGFGRYHRADKIRFYHIARGSISECMSHICISKDLGFVVPEEAEKFLVKLKEIRMMLNGMINSLRKLSRDER